MYHSYSRSGSPLPNPLLDRASQHRAGSEVKSDSTMTSQALPHVNAARSTHGSTSPQIRKRALGGTGAVSPKSGARNSGEASAEMDKRRGGSPVAATIEESEGYRQNGSSSLRGNPYPSIRRSRSPPSMSHPESRGVSPLPARGFRRMDSESARREGGGYTSRTQNTTLENPQHSPSTHHASTKRCSDCGRTEAEVGLILPLTEEGGKQYCKGCCEYYSIIYPLKRDLHICSSSRKRSSGTIPQPIRHCRPFAVSHIPVLDFSSTVYACTPQCSQSKLYTSRTIVQDAFKCDFAVSRSTVFIFPGFAYKRICSTYGIWIITRNL